MGYTHYWTFRRAKGKTAKELETAYKKALVECSKVAVLYNAECKAKGLDDERLSGYSAHCKPGTYGGLKLNGKEYLAHEDFVMREHFSEAVKDGFQFCKTARKPYDVVVVACLAILKYRLGDAIQVDSDGYAEEWTDGVELAKRLLKRKRIANPNDNFKQLTLQRGKAA